MYQEKIQFESNKRSIQLFIQLLDLSHGVSNLPLGERVQLAKFGNAKIYVVKKKPLINVENTQSSSALNSCLNKVTIFNQGSPMNARTLDEFQNTPLNQIGLDPNGGILKASKSLTPLRNGNPNTSSSNIDTPLKETPQLININASSQPSTNPSFHNSAMFNSSHKHVNFAINEEQANLSYSNSSKDKIEQNRLQNTKSVISMFTSNSGKTNHSAPLGNNHKSLSESPKRQFKIKKDLVYHHHKKSSKNLQKSKKRLRANSTTGLGQFKGTMEKQMNMTHSNFSQSKLEASHSLERTSSIKGKKVIPLKQIKFPLKKASTNQNGQIPKPPRQRKQNLMEENHNQTNPEFLLKMADESLANIDNELNQSRKNSKQSRMSINQESSLDSRKSNTLQPKSQIKDIQTNFNLSFNNSFNTSYNHNDKNQPQVLAFSSSSQNINEKNNLNPKTEYQGFFTHDAVQLEKQLTTRLKEASDNEDKKLQAFNQTFNEIIKRDKNFGHLLLKIKQAYDEYLRKSLSSQQISPVAVPSYEELQQRVESQSIEISAQKQKNEELSKQISFLKEDLDAKRIQIEGLSQENDRLNNYESFKLSKVYVTQENSQNDTLKSLQFSNSSNRTQPKQQKGTAQQRISTNSLNSNHNKQQLLQDINSLVGQNVELTQACSQMNEELKYLKLREKKIMYLVYVLQSKGYPVNQVFENEVKSIPTMRFQEFLNSHPELDEQMHVETEEDLKNMYSFRTDDSYELLNTKEMKAPVRPEIVPPLNLNDLPVYESSSSEGDPEPQQPANLNEQQYQESLKYIENFYNKYATQTLNVKNNHQSSHSLEATSLAHQVSSQEGLSRDYEDDIKEELSTFQQQ